MCATDNDAATQAVPLIASPTMIVALLSPEVREASSKHHAREHIAHSQLTPTAALEVYFSRTLGFTLLTLGALTVLLTGSVPLSSRLNEGTIAPPSLALSCDTDLFHRRHYVQHGSESSLRASHAYHHGNLPRHLRLLLLRHVD
jgi:hypothetical protein